MPSPISHVAIGAALYPLWVRDRFGRGPRLARVPLMLLITVGLSVLPDVDAAVGIAYGNLARFHNNFTSSPVFGTLVAVAVGVLVALSRRASFQRGFLLTFVCYQLHVFMDFVTVGRGLMMLWPLSNQRIQPPFHLFYGLHWSDGLVSHRHWITLATEMGFVLLLAVAVWWVQSRRTDPGRPS